MTPERLAHIKAHITNPPSASLNREWMMELVEAVEHSHAAPPVVVLRAPLPSPRPSPPSVVAPIAAAIDEKPKKKATK